MEQPVALHAQCRPVRSPDERSDIRDFLDQGAQDPDPVIAGLDTGSRVYPTSGASYCATRASPSCGAIHPLARSFYEDDGPPEIGFTRFRALQVRKSD